jgi:hypothetical protein
MYNYQLLLKNSDNLPSTQFLDIDNLCGPKTISKIIILHDGY